MGGGTDLPSYYSQYGGFVLSAAINKYVYISLNRPQVDDLTRVKYSKSERVEDLNSLRVTTARWVANSSEPGEGASSSSTVPTPVRGSFKGKLRRTMVEEGLREMPFNFDFEGAKVLVGF